MWNLLVSVTQLINVHAGHFVYILCCMRSVPKLLSRAMTSMTLNSHIVSVSTTAAWFILWKTSSNVECWRSSSVSTAAILEYVFAELIFQTWPRLPEWWEVLLWWKTWSQLKSTVWISNIETSAWKPQSCCMISVKNVLLLMEIMLTNKSYCIGKCSGLKTSGTPLVVRDIVCRFVYTYWRCKRSFVQSVPQ